MNTNGVGQFFQDQDGMVLAYMSVNIGKADRWNTIMLMGRIECFKNCFKVSQPDGEIISAGVVPVSGIDIMKLNGSDIETITCTGVGRFLCLCCIRAKRIGYN